MIPALFLASECNQVPCRQRQKLHSSGQLLQAQTGQVLWGDRLAWPALPCRADATSWRRANELVKSDQSPWRSRPYLPTTITRCPSHHYVPMADRAALAALLSYQVAAPVTHRSGARVAKYLWRYAPPRSEDPVWIDAPCRRSTPCRFARHFGPRQFIRMPLYFATARMGRRNTPVRHARRVHVRTASLSSITCWARCRGA
jgi:hypothetical protein